MAIFRNLCACHAALSIQNVVEEYGDKVKKNHGVDFKMRIGLNSGLVIVDSKLRARLKISTINRVMLTKKDRRV